MKMRYAECTQPQPQPMLQREFGEGRLEIGR